MSCLKQHASFSELKSCTWPGAGHHEAIARWQSAKEQLAPCFSCSARSLRFLSWQTGSDTSCCSAFQPPPSVPAAQNWVAAPGAGDEVLLGGGSAELEAT